MIINFKTWFTNNMFVIILILTAFIFRVILINTINLQRIAPDGTGYHTIAVNMVKGNGYSNSQQAPFEEFFLREPGYPVFIAVIYKTYVLFGGSIKYLNSYNLTDYTFTDYHPELLLLKYCQAIIDTLTVLFFYLSLLFVFKKKYALIIAFVWALFLPQTIMVTTILRETLLALFSMVVVYSFLKYIHTKRIKWLIILSIFWAFSCLTFQFSLVLGFFLFAFLLIYTKNLVLTFKNSILAGIILLLLSSPWLLRTYNYYPDIRIVKSYGTSLTSEYRSLINAVFTAQYYSVLQDDSVLRGGYLCLPEREKFRLSFCGELTGKADSINKLINEPFITKRKTKKLISSLIGTWFSRLRIPIEYNPSDITVAKYKFAGFNFLGKAQMISSIIGIAFGLFGVFGFFLFFRKTLQLLLVFTMYITFFFVIGTESRRMLPAQPFIVMFSVITILYFIKYLLHQTSYKEFEKEIFY